VAAPKSPSAGGCTRTAFWRPLTSALFRASLWGVDAYRHCMLCPRHCGVDRAAGEKGFCRETAACRIASAGPHHGEEPVFSGTRGSGTIFFSGCSCRCFFCQNYQISLENSGYGVSDDELLDVAHSLVAQGVHNLNFVTPDHFGRTSKRLCRRLREEGCATPFLFNSSATRIRRWCPRTRSGWTSSCRTLSSQNRSWRSCA